MKYRKLLIVIFSSFACLISGSFVVSSPVKIDIDAAKEGPIYGNVEGLLRVQKLEAELHNMKIRKGHPRIFITEEMLPEIREKIKLYNNSWQDVLAKAEGGDLISAAFCYAVLKDVNAQGSKVALEIAKKQLFEMEPKSENGEAEERIAAGMALAFDWAYSGLSNEERDILIPKISRLTKLKERAEKINKGYKEIFETFHREEWFFNSWKMWPEVALSNHAPEADACFKARWSHGWYWGDAARMCAYAADGTPFEGYYYGADGVDWFLMLRSATGINLIDGEFGWCKNAAYNILYRLDLDRGREIFHKGVGLGGAGCTSYREGTVAWKMQKFFGRTLVLAKDNPYINWLLETETGFSEWIVGMIGYGGMHELSDISRVIFGDSRSVKKDLREAVYEDLPLGMLFPGGNEAYMRTGWFDKPACVGFRSSPAYTKTSHGDFDVNTFVIYKDGVLCPDSGFYDCPEGQNNYFGYQKNTTAHNDIVVIHPLLRDEPRKLAGWKPDPGGVDCVFTRTFGALSRFGAGDVFLHNPNADWADIIDFKTTPEYDYVIGDARKAYKSRLKEYLRSLVFIRKGNSAYVIIFDRVEARLPIYIKKSLVHLVTEPKMNGEIVKTKIKDHYEIFNADFFESENAFGTSKLFCKVLLPRNKVLSKIGGEGYEFYVEGNRPQNFPISKRMIKDMEEQMGGSWKEVGTWRIEITPAKPRNRDYFMHVIYITDMGDVFNPDDVTLAEEKDFFTVNIKDDKLKDVKVKFNKTGKQIVDISINK